MRLTTGSIVGAFAVLVIAASDSRAQNFVGGSGNSFDPQISVVNTGTVLDTQATVSADRKYVTLTMRPQVASLIALRDFVFQSGNGIVGMPGGGNGNANANGNANNANGGRNASPRGPLMPALARPAEPTPVLLQEGMHRVDQPATGASNVTAIAPASSGSSTPGK